MLRNLARIKGIADKESFRDKSKVVSNDVVEKKTIETKNKKTRQKGVVVVSLG